MSASESARVLSMALLALTAAVMSSCGESGATNADHTPERDAPPPAEAQPAPAVTEEQLAHGRTLYNEHCLECHQPDGYGVPGVQPPLVDSHIVRRDPDRMIRMVIRGVGGGPGAMRSSGMYGGVMNAFGHLSDEDLAALLSFVRVEFGGVDEGVTTEDIARIREDIAGQ